MAKESPDSRVKEASVVFGSALDADAFCSYWRHFSNANPAKRGPDSPTRFVVQYKDRAALALEGFFRKVCADHGAADCFVLARAAPILDHGKPTADPFVQGLIESVSPILESLPKHLQATEEGKCKALLQLHIQKAFADKFLATIPVTADAEQIVVSACLAGSHAAMFASTMQAEFDAIIAAAVERGLDPAA